jgi:hypothetical protein
MFKKTGVLTVRGETNTCRVAILQGSPRAATSVPGEDKTLGDLLLREGKLDWARHQRALIREEPLRPVGDWLVETGAAPRSAVERALREQHQSRIRRLFYWRDTEFEFVEGRAEIGLPLIKFPIPISEVILDTFKAIFDRDLNIQLDKHVGSNELRITEMGRTLLADAAVSQDEAKMVVLLEQGCRLEAITRATNGSERAMKTLIALFRLGAVAKANASSAPYSLLLHKRQQLRNSASPAALLDLPKGASAQQARKALRKLACQIHPDRFGLDESPALQRASQQVMAALCNAESGYREQGGNSVG